MTNSNSDQKIAFITGSTGFIGSLLAERLIEAGWEVRCLVRHTSSLKWLEGLSVQLVTGSLFDESTLAAALAECTHVFHLAGVTKALTEEAYFRSNGEGTRAALAACLRHADRLQRFIYVSSIAAAGPSVNGTAVTEDDAPRPVSIYGRSKLAGEVACAEYKELLPITIVRPPIVYGPRDRDVYEYFKQVKLGVIFRLGHVKRRASFIHVYDLIRGMIAAGCQSAAAGETFFITNAKAWDWDEVASAITAALDRRPFTVTLPEFFLPAVAAASTLWSTITRRPALVNRDKVAEMKEISWVASGEKARAMLGFEAQIPLVSGMQQTAAWYQKNGWL